GLWDELYRLKTSMEDVEGVCGAATFMEKKEEMWPFKDQEMDCGACKQLVGEGGESLRCLDAM
nr:hypothetical protein [Tanacetum cinerariifolium]